MKRGKIRYMWIVLGVLLIVTGFIFIFFNISYSKTHKRFSDTTDGWINEAGRTEEVFTTEDIEGLPEIVQKYFHHTGFIGKTKMNYLRSDYYDVAFKMAEDKPTMNISYSVVNIVETPKRMAYIDASLYGIPFEGLDTFHAAETSMQGTLAKVIPLFNQHNKELKISTIATVLSEALIVPNIALQDYITWEEIDDNRARAVMTYEDITVSGDFIFNDRAEMIQFTTNDRIIVNPDGSIDRTRWSVKCGDYYEKNGIKRPTSFQAIWHYPHGDYIYFDADNIDIQYGYKR